MNDQDKRLGSSGVFRVIMDSARRIKRAFAEGEPEPSEAAFEMGEKIAQAFVASRFADIYEMGTPGFRERSKADRFVEIWRDEVKRRGGLTGFDVSNAGQINLEYVPGLEEVPQKQFAAFLEIVFSTPEVPLDHENAFTVGVVLLDDGALRVGAMHTR